MNLAKVTKCGGEAVLRLLLHEPVVDKFIACMEGQKIVDAETCRKLDGKLINGACVIPLREYY